MDKLLIALALLATQSALADISGHQPNVQDTRVSDEPGTYPDSSTPSLVNTTADTTIRDNVSKALSRDGTLSKYSIQASVDGGVVTLKGAVYSESDKRKAGSVAAQVFGVNNVDNQLTVQKQEY